MPQAWEIGCFSDWQHAHHCHGHSKVRVAIVNEKHLYILKSKIKSKE